MINQIKHLVVNSISIKKRSAIAIRFLNSLGFGETNLEIESKFLSNFANKTHLEDFSILDVGSSVGAYAKKLVKQTDAKIVCFEPSVVAFKKSLENLEQEIESLKVKVFNLGVIVNDGQFNPSEIFSTTLYTNEIGSDRASLFSISSEGEKANFIDCQTLNKYVDSKIVAIKLDIEGYEIKLMKDLTSYLKDPDFVCLQFEFGVNTEKANVKFSDIFDYLIDLGFVIKRISPRGVIDVPHYSPIFEINWPTNYLAVKRDYVN